MNIFLELQELDDLIVRFTTPPNTTALQGKLRPIIQAVKIDQEERVKIMAEKSQVESRYANLVAETKVKETQKPAELVLNMGVKWKRTLNGFEPNPYCPKCGYVMHRNPPDMELYWQCSCDAIFPGSAFIYFGVKHSQPTSDSQTAIH
jgi:hypothetical protein